MGSASLYVEELCRHVAPQAHVQQARVRVRVRVRVRARVRVRVRARVRVRFRARVRASVEACNGWGAPGYG